MKCRRVTLLVLGLATLLVMVSATVVLAGQGVLPGKPGDYGNYYDPSTEEVISGRISEVCQVPYTHRSSLRCYALRVERDDGEGVEVVYLGPKSRLDKAGIELKEGEKICVLGSRVEVEGQVVMIAQQVNQGDEVSVLRNESGRHFSTKELLHLPHEVRATCLVAYRGN